MWDVGGVARRQIGSRQAEQAGKLLLQRLLGRGAGGADGADAIHACGFAEESGEEGVAFTLAIDRANGKSVWPKVI